MIEYPLRLIVEISTRCNLNCEMCFLNEVDTVSQKYYMTFEEFTKLTPILGKVKSLVLSGFGEPLLNRDIFSIVKYSSEIIPRSSTIGIQTNGIFLDKEVAELLIESGVNKLCISVDRLEGDNTCHSLKGVTDALKLLSNLKTKNKNISYGIEIVISKDNLKELLSILENVSFYNIDFVLLSHLIPYSKNMTSKVAYDTNNKDSVDIFTKWTRILEESGYTTDDWLKVAKKMTGEFIEYDLKCVELYKQMYEEAEKLGLTLNLNKLMELDKVFLNEVEALLMKAEEFCNRNKIFFKIPSVHPKSKRICEFIENSCMFVSVDGDVSPCYFLWHNIECYIGNLRKKVKKKIFGNIKNANPLEIYNRIEYKKFRETVAKYEYPYCYDCNFALCDLMELENFIYDCYSNEIPCGACLWCGDLFNCLI